MAPNAETSIRDGPESAPTDPDAAAIEASGVEEKKHTKKRKKRQRGQKAKLRIVTAVGEEPRERQLGKGKVRRLDILRGDPDSTKLPRKTRELLSRMKKFNDLEKGTGRVRDGVQDIQNKTVTDRRTTPRGNGTGERVEHSAVVAPKKNVETRGDVFDELQYNSDENEGTDVNTKQSSKKRTFDGMQPGENFVQFSARLRKESKQMMLETARKGNHQREKKRAYYERRKERALRKKRRKRGDFSDSDVEDDIGDDWDESKSIAHLPSYWQEVLRNNGRPVSAKRRKRLQRAEDEAVDKVAFGEQAERPPEFSVLPVHRGRKDGV